MLGSGSRGNATVVQAGRTTVLMDCGFLLREAEFRLARLGLKPSDLDGILVTHEHADHIGGVSRFARKHELPVWLTPGTYAGWRDPIGPGIRNISPHDAFSIGDLDVQPYPVPHDAREPCQFVFSDGHFRVGVLSDAGSVTGHMLGMLSGCDALMIEFNYDVDMLENGPYPPPLRARVGGPQGHLSNRQAADLLRALDRSHLRHLVLTHLSQKNNTPAHALAACVEALGCDPDWPVVADQDAGLAWRELA
jgi:phosphoribosyl 1,2-cyclic phosphodiesterase